MFRRRLVGAAAVACIAAVIGVVAAGAQASAPVRDTNGAAAKAGPNGAAPNNAVSPNQVIFSNLGAGNAYDTVLGWCVTGLTSAPADGCGGSLQRWIGSAFTGNGGNVTQIDVALTYDNGTNGATVQLAADNGSGLPGNVLRSWSVSGQPPVGTCCGLTTLTVSPSIPVGSGKTYWVVVKPAGTSTSDLWDENTVGDYGPVAGNHNGSGWFSEGPPSATLRGAFDVLGCAKICRVS
jgi:hypothetical protein